MFLAIAFLFPALPALASTQAIFAADGTKATVLLMSMTAGDSDAANLFAALAVPEEVIDGKHTKRFNFDNSSGTRALSIVCVLSAFVATNGTCTVIMHATTDSYIDKGSTTARLTVRDPADLAKILPAFHMPPANDVIFSTADGHLMISAFRKSGSIMNFEVNYR